MDTAKMIGKNLLIAGVLLFIVLGVLKPMFTSFAAARPAPPAGDDGDAAGPQALSYQQHVDRAKQFARSDPKAAATVVREWVSDGK